MKEIYKYKGKKDYSIDIRTRYVNTLSGRITGRRKKDFRFLNWIADEIEKMPNQTEFVTIQILKGFADLGITEPVSDEEKENNIEDIQHFVNSIENKL